MTAINSEGLKQTQGKGEALDGLDGILREAGGLRLGSGCARGWGWRGLLKDSLKAHSQNVRMGACLAQSDNGTCKSLEISNTEHKVTVTVRRQGLQNETVRCSKGTLLDLHNINFTRPWKWTGTLITMDCPHLSNPCIP